MIWKEAKVKQGLLKKFQGQEFYQETTQMAKRPSHHSMQDPILTWTSITLANALVNYFLKVKVRSISKVTIVHSKEYHLHRHHLLCYLGVTQVVLLKMLHDKPHRNVNFTNSNCHHLHQTVLLFKEKEAKVKRKEGDKIKLRDSHRNQYNKMRRD
jgi:hypothetical protein